MKFFLISDNVDTRTGMRLAGIDGCIVHTRNEIKDAFKSALADTSIGIILITEKLSREFPDIVDDIKLNRKQPLLVEIPDRHGTGRRSDLIPAYVNEAIGLKL